MRQEYERETLNGSTALVILKLDSIQRDVIEHRHETRIGMQTLTTRLDTLEAKGSALDRLKDLSGWLTGAIILILALAGKWNELGAFLGASGR
ncbi:protein of unknown function [Hyphomicrobium sp. 1Nfss2.1]|uniref:hypothetical protein n=1 Tax=Hyphomicrobium sp. 1Nfss2.1 TaxID=3413936 RepID=UPI003C7E76B6